MLEFNYKKLQLALEVLLEQKITLAKIAEETVISRKTLSNMFNGRIESTKYTFPLFTYFAQKLLDKGLAETEKQAFLMLFDIALEEHIEDPVLVAAMSSIDKYR